MKKQILALMFLVPVSTSVLATGVNDPSGDKVKQVKLKAAFSKLVVNGDVDVVLFEDSTTVISIDAGDRNYNTVSFTEANGVLTVNCNKLLGKRIVVAIPVQHLESIEAKGTSRVSGVTLLESPELLLVINDDSKIAVRTNGKVTIEEGVGTDLCYTTIRKRP